LVPRSDGRVLIGATEENAGFDKNKTATAINDFLTFGIEMAPSLAQAALERSWAGLRPGSPDGHAISRGVPGLRQPVVARRSFPGPASNYHRHALVMKELLLDSPPVRFPWTPRLDRQSSTSLPSGVSVLSALRYNPPHEPA